MKEWSDDNNHRFASCGQIPLGVLDLEGVKVKERIAYPV